MDSKRVPTSDTERARSLLAAGRPGEAMALLEAVLQVNPGSAEAHAVLGSALAAGGDREKSLAHFERACALDPERASFRFNLGYAFEVVGSFARARQEYQ